MVFIVGLDDGMLPHNRSLDDPEEMAEERRLFYVGLTRAKNRVYLVRAAQRSTYGSFQDFDRPRASWKISPASCCRKTAAVGAATRRGAATPPPGSRATCARDASAGRHSRAALSAPILQPRYRAGMRVSHPAWGEGLVVDSRLQDDDETVDVFFESVGFKRLAASLANLEIIK